MSDEIDWERVVERSDELARVMLEQQGFDPTYAVFPSDVIYEFCKDGLGKANPKSCYE